MFHGGPRMMLMQETSKPKRTSETLARLGWYFRAWWPMLALSAILVIASTWMQVTTPELMGQLVDCYLAPAGSAASGAGPASLMSFGSAQPASASQSNCWLTSPGSAERLDPNGDQVGVLSRRIPGARCCPQRERTGVRADPHRNLIGDPVYRRQPADRRDLLLDDLGRAARAARPAHRRLRAPAPPAGLATTPSMKPAT